MITDKLKTILAASGCTLVVYDQEQLANLYTDQSNSTDTVGIIMRPAELVLEVRANAIAEHYSPLYVEILKQAALEEKAEENEAMLQELLDTCKEFIVRLIADAEFKTLLPVRVVRILEPKYDANLIGWQLPLDLYYLHNETRVPCL